MNADELTPLVDDGVEISDDDFLIRIIQPMYAIFSTDPIGIQSNGFQDQTIETAKSFGLAGPCASVAVQSIWQRDCNDHAALLEDFDPRSGLARLSVRAVRHLTNPTGTVQLPHGVMLNPRPGAPWHAVIWDVRGTPRSKAGQRGLVEVAEWLVPPRRE